MFRLSVIVLLWVAPLTMSFVSTASAEIPWCSQYVCVNPCPVHGPGNFGAREYQDCNSAEGEYFCYGRCTWLPCNCHSGWVLCNTGNPGYCFLAGTSIEMADGKTKSIEDIRKGDLVMAFDESLIRPASVTVAKMHEPHVVDHFFIINDKIRVSATQPLVSGGRWLEAQALAVGQMLTARDGTPVPIISLKKIEQKAEVFNFEVGDVHTFIADGVVAHNKEMIEVRPE